MRQERCVMRAIIFPKLPRYGIQPSLHHCNKCCETNSTLQSVVGLCVLRQTPPRTSSNPLAPNWTAAAKLMMGPGTGWDRRRRRRRHPDPPRGHGGDGSAGDELQQIARLELHWLLTRQSRQNKRRKKGGRGRPWLPAPRKWRWHQRGAAGTVGVGRSQ